MRWEDELAGMSAAFARAFADRDFVRLLLLALVISLLISAVAELTRPRVYILPTKVER